PPTRMWSPRSSSWAIGPPAQPGRWNGAQYVKGPVPAKCGHRPLMGFFYRLVGEMTPVVLEDQTERGQDRAADAEDDEPPAEHDAERDGRGRQRHEQRPP